jgi:hypothetical protein
MLAMWGVPLMAPRRLRKKCPTTGKIGYRDEPAAQWGMGWTNKRMDDAGAITPRIIAVYCCPFCPGWHLTSHAQHYVDRQARAEPPGV